MDVPEKLLQFKFHFIFLTLFSILVALIVTYSSSIVTFFSYFWPLVVSTGLFFAAVVVFGRISPPEADCPGEKTGAELIDYVAGHPEMKVEDTHLLDNTHLLETDLQGGEERVRELLENESRKQLTEPLLHGEGNQSALQETSFTNFFCQPSVLGKDLYTIVKFGLVQYMILKTFCSFLALLLEYFGVYGEGQFSWHYGYPYIAGVINFSQMWALYCLVQFYNVTHHRLQSIRPLAKFISFKAIVFATWWQGVGIAILCSLGVLPKQGKFQNGLQDFLICIEEGKDKVVWKWMPPPSRSETVQYRLQSERQVWGQQVLAVPFC